MDVQLPDGTRVRALGIRDRLADDPERDFGLYLDPAWVPSWEADEIDWPDFGTPARPELAARQIRNAFERARAGQRIEIGCLGGVGRTGTVLACMAVLAGTPAGDAVAWVRANYHPRAVETSDQEAWVSWFEQHIESQRQE